LPTPISDDPTPVEWPYWHPTDGTNINDIEPLIMLSGASFLKWFGPNNLQRGMLAWDTGAEGLVSIDIYGGRCWYGNGGLAITAITQLCNLAKSRGTAYLRLIGCRDYNGLNPFPDYVGTLTGSLPL
jgi:hypothetical protein